MVRAQYKRPPRKGGRALQYLVLLHYKITSLPVGPELAPVPEPVPVPEQEQELVPGPVAEAVSWLAARQAAVPLVFSHIQKQLRK